MSRGSHAVVRVVVWFSLVWFVAASYVAASVFMLAGAAFAQDAATGALRGAVVDPSGGRVAQASIVAVNLATGLRYSTTTDAEGRFAFDLLPPGDYSARATAKGMSPQVTPQLHVDVGGVADLEPAPEDFAVDDPLFGAGEAEAVDVEAERGFEVRDPEKGNGLLDVGLSLLGLGFEGRHECSLSAELFWLFFGEGLPEFDAVAFGIDDPCEASVVGVFAFGVDGYACGGELRE